MNTIQKDITQDNAQFPSKTKVQHEDGFLLLEKSVVLVRKGPNDVIPERTWINPIFVENNQEQDQGQDKDGHNKIQIINNNLSKKSQEKDFFDQPITDKTNKEVSTLQKDDKKEKEFSDDHNRYNSQLKCQCHAVFTSESSSLPTNAEKSVKTKTLQPFSGSKVNQSNCDGRIECAPFLGNMSHQLVTCSCKHCSMDFTDGSSEVKPKRRSDASMMLGLILWNVTHELVDLISIQLLLHKPIQSSNSTSMSSPSAETTCESTDSPGKSNFSHDSLNESCSEQSYILFQASLAITLSLSFVTSGNNTSKHHRRGGVLPMPTQLLLSILKSDWKNFDFAKKELKNFDNIENRDQLRPNEKSVSFFPTELSLQQLYSRIESSFEKSSISFQTQSSYHNIENLDMQPRSQCNLSSLPSDILELSIAPFLRAKSLYALRSCSKSLHEGFKSVVPGLKLTLYKHQISSLEWMRNREKPQLTEEKLLSVTNYHHLGFDKGVVDLHKCITACSTVLLERRKIGTDSNTELLRVDAITGRIIKRQELNLSDSSKNISHESKLVNLGKKIARGGLICDEPGLGKTITVLSLIMQTFGLSTELDNDHTQFSTSIDDIDDEIFLVYWRSLAPYVRTQILSKILNQIGKEDKLLLCKKSIYIFQEDNNNESKNKKEATNFQQIKKNVSKDVYKNCFNTFKIDMIAYFENLVKSFSDVTLCNEVKRLMETSLQLIKVMKKDQIEKTSSVAFGKNDSISLLLKRKEETMKFKTLIPSSSTLIIAPSMLIPHWKEQIMLHVDPSAFSRKIPIIYRHATTKRQYDSLFQNDGIYNLKNVIKLMKDGTHFPFLFIDEASKIDLPSSDILALFPIVLTSRQRISREWASGSLESELQVRTRVRSRPIRFSEVYESDEYNTRNNAASPLLKVHWLRLVMDEGHDMGNSGRVNAIEMASWICAQRRWVMTGTPTPQKAGKNGLKNIWNLTNFLQHEFFSFKFDGDTLWRRNLTRPWKNGDLVSFFRLKSFLSLLMVRHTKAHHVELHKPSHQYTRLTMSTKEILAYNTLVSSVRANIIITSMEGKTSGWQDSLLNPSQSSHAQRVFTNIRLMCCGGARIITLLSLENWYETMNLLEKKHKIDPISSTVVRNYLDRASRSEATSCMSCGMQLQTLLLLPCAHLICTHCIDSKSTTCPACYNNFNIDDFQELQPGFENRIEWITSDEDETKPNIEGNEQISNSNLNQELLDNVNQVEHIGSNQNLQVGQRRRKCKFCVFPAKFKDGKCLHCLKEHYECNFLNTDAECKICHRLAEPCPKTETKAYYLIEKLIELINEMNDKKHCRRISDAAKRLFGNEVRSIPQARPLKVLIFSQFRQILNFVGSRLLKRFGASCIAEYWGRYRAEELEKFKSSECFCMLLGKDGSHGLDLSFATHIYFLEGIADKSLEDQVIARAYRMGATGGVEVEQLLAKNTIEELMLLTNKKFYQFGGNLNKKYSIGSQDLWLEPNNMPLHDLQGTSKSIGGKHVKHEKLRFLLTNLKLIGVKRKIEKNCKDKESDDIKPISKRRRVHFN